MERAPVNSKKGDPIPLIVALQQEGSLRKFQNDYLYWDKLKYKTGDRNPEEVWAALKFHRKLYRNTVQFGKYIFFYTVTDFMQRALHQFDLHFGGSLGSNIGIAETDKNKFIISSIMEEAISSSQIEGANTTRKKAKEMIQNDRKPRTKSEQMILNNFITMKHIVQNKDEEITPDSILHIHKLITNNTLEDPSDEGRYRSGNDVYVVNHSTSEVLHTPPPQEELAILVQSLCHFCNHETEQFIHPIIKGCIVHFMMGWIHPFTDGNGRAARALFYWYMLKKGYGLTEYLSISRIIQGTKTQYEKAILYTEIDDYDLGYFITYHLKTMEKAFEALKAYISRKQKEVLQAAKFLKIAQVNDRMAQILKIVHDDPERILSIKEIESRFYVSSFTARTDLKQLVDLGFLEIVPVNKKKHIYIRSKQFDKLIDHYLK